MMILVVFWLACAVAGYLIGQQKGTAGQGAALGLLLGPIGLLIIFATAGNRVECPFCRERIHPDAVVCPHCQRGVRAVPPVPLARDTAPAADGRSVATDSAMPHGWSRSRAEVLAVLVALVLFWAWALYSAPTR